ncbi:hypothetical protein ALQ56_200188 [Pseudomonas syringae pv. papulans]|nr:hypothetical protein ALQ56_200188 [Pseudomonas syringae pv. papulans]
MQAAVQYASLDFGGSNHADIDVHARATLFQACQCMSAAHVGKSDQVVGQALALYQRLAHELPEQIAEPIEQPARG